MNKKNKVISALCLFAITSCGGRSSGTDENEYQEMLIAKKTYKAVLRPYNFTAAGWIPNGMTDIKIIGDQIEVKSWLDDSSNVVHMQNIHLGTQCPTAAHDTNQDGFIDFNETLKVTNKILIPLDSDLNSQSSGLSVYPKGDFSYLQTASLSAIINDLKQKNFSDNLFMSKLKQGESLNLEGKVILIAGVAADRGKFQDICRLNFQEAIFS